MLVQYRGVGRYECSCHFFIFYSVLLQHTKRQEVLVGTCSLACDFVHKKTTEEDPTRSYKSGSLELAGTHRNPEHPKSNPGHYLKGTGSYNIVCSVL